MKNWKNVLAAAVITLFVLALGYAGSRIGRPSPEQQARRDIKNRIEQFRIVKEEQQLIRDILQYKYEIAVIQSKFSPAPPTQPVVEPPKEKE